MNPSSIFPDLRRQKQDLRRLMETRRAELRAGQPEAGSHLRDRFLAALSLTPGAVLAGYIAHGSEIDPALLIEALRAEGYPIVLPVMAGKGTALIFRRHEPGDRLVAGPTGIPEPEATASAVEPDVVPTPLLAFDRRCHRLGYGGDDDRLRGPQGQKAGAGGGAGFRRAGNAGIPAGTHDMHLDRIVTEREAFQA